MRKTILLFSFIGCCLALFSQKQICVDGSATISGDGTASNPYRTIRAAVDAASNGDIIKVAKGTYSEAVRIWQKRVQLLGGFAGNGDFNTANPQANATIIKGTSAAPCVMIYIDEPVNTGTLKISGFTIREGQRGIELSGAWSGHLNNITIENNIIENNGIKDTDQRGGGIGLEGNNVIIQNNVIRNNRSGRGAAIGGTDELIANFLIADNRIENNTGYGDHGGGVIINGTGTITRNIFDGNVVDCDWGWGGGITVVNYDTTKVITLSHNVWRNNRAPDRGGAVFVDEGAKVRMEHELLYNNKTKASGSAIYVDEDWMHNPSVLYMYNCTVAGNDAGGGTALFVQASKTHVENCIFWNNGSDFEFLADGQPLATLTVNYTLTQQGYAGTGNIKSDPLFANASNGDFHLRSTKGRFDPSIGQFVNDNVDSPAIDAGNPASDYSNEPAPNGGRVNLGCYGNTPEASKSGFAGNKAITQMLWTIFPNPAKEIVTISHLPIGSNITITDLTGKRVYGTVVRNEQTIISVTNFENGIYIVQVTYNGTVEGKKLIVSK